MRSECPLACLRAGQAAMARTTAWSACPGTACCPCQSRQAAAARHCGQRTKQSAHRRACLSRLSRSSSYPVDSSRRSAAGRGALARRFDGEPASEEQLLALLRLAGEHVRALALRHLPAHLDLGALLQHLPRWPPRRSAARRGRPQTLRACSRVRWAFAAPLSTRRR